MSAKPKKTKEQLPHTQEVIDEAIGSMIVAIGRGNFKETACQHLLLMYSLGYRQRRQDEEKKKK